MLKGVFWGAFCGWVGTIFIYGAFFVPDRPLFIGVSVPLPTAEAFQWIFTGLGALIGGMIPVWLDDRDAKEAARKEKEAELKRQQLELERHKEQQRKYREQLAGYGQQSLGVFESMPPYLRTAEEHLDQAEVDLAEGVADPFWDSIEGAVRGLGDFNHGVRQINQYSLEYTKLIKEYEAEPPKFPLSPQSVAKLAVSTATADRMSAIVRKARRNTDFAMLYHTRKTNEILVAGFTNLAQALDHMTSRITSSIDDLASSVDAMGSTLNDSMREIHSRMDESAEATAEHRKTLSREASASAAREEKVVKMLDNIQRGRKPSAWDA